jgi:hypothetical protein
VRAVGEGLGVPETAAVGPADGVPVVEVGPVVPESVGVGAVGPADGVPVVEVGPVVPESLGVGAVVVGPADAPCVLVGGPGGDWTMGVGGVLATAGATVIASRTLLCWGSSTHVASAGVAAAVPSLFTGVTLAVRLPSKIFAVPGWVKANVGVVPAASAVIGPDAGTGASAIVSGTDNVRS